MIMKVMPTETSITFADCKSILLKLPIVKKLSDIVDKAIHKIIKTNIVLISLVNNSSYLLKFF